jgi:hypothetical protein
MVSGIGEEWGLILNNYFAYAAPGISKIFHYLLYLLRILWVCEAQASM